MDSLSQENVHEDTFTKVIQLYIHPYVLKEQKCSPLSIGENVIVSTDRLEWGTEVMFSCEPGYLYWDRTVRRSLECLPFGEWSSDTHPFCSREYSLSSMVIFTLLSYCSISLLLLLVLMFL